MPTNVTVALFVMPAQAGTPRERSAPPKHPRRSRRRFCPSWIPAFAGMMFSLTGCAAPQSDSYTDDARAALTAYEDGSPDADRVPRDPRGAPLLKQLAWALPFYDDELPQELEFITSGSYAIICDGYVYTLYHEPAANRYWLRATGGISGLLMHWKGPADADHAVVRDVLAMVTRRVDVAIPRSEVNAHPLSSSRDY